jgi:hypothetical protein
MFDNSVYVDKEFFAQKSHAISRSLAHCMGNTCVTFV